MSNPFEVEAGDFVVLRNDEGQYFHTCDVKIVCRFVQQQEIGAGQFEEQNLEPCLLTAGERLE